MTCRHAASGCNYPEGECAGTCMRMKTATKWMMKLEPGMPVEPVKPVVATPEPEPVIIDLWVPTLAFLMGVGTGAGLLMLYLQGTM